MEMQLDLPKKSYFKAEEICAIADIDFVFLKFLESQFNEITPILSSSGQKYYEEKDIEVVLCLKILITEEKLSVDVSKERLATLMADREIFMSYILDRNSDSTKICQYDDTETLEQMMPPELNLKDGEKSEIAIEVEQEKENEKENEKDYAKLILAQTRLRELKLFMDSIRAKHNWNS
ncbi:MAG: hypothetical protein HQK49_03400 [Oligoflexia bacterium]|nr:hypothetical protein [Oligoflexia bacterium]